jgi:p24 family protein delta-1
MLSLLLIPLTLSSEVILKIEPTQTRCIGENLGKNELLLVSVDFVSVPVETGMTLTVDSDEVTKESAGKSQSTSSANAIKPPLLSEKLISGFSRLTTSTESGAYNLCLTPSAQVEVAVKLAYGPNAKDYSSLAKKEHMEKSQLILEQITDSLKSYYQNLLHLRERENSMRMTYDTTSSKVMFAAGMSISILGISTLLKIFYFKRFFKSKKII